MGFQGNLKTMHLGDVFQNIMQNRSNGVLKIQTKEFGRVSIFFMDGDLTLYHSQNLEGVQWSRVLLSKAEMSQDEVEMIESQGIRGEEELSGIIASKIINEDQAAVNLQHVIEEEVFELFKLADGEFGFESASEIPALFHYTELFKKTIFNTNSLLMEAARRSDENYQEGDVSSFEIFVQNNAAQANKAGLTEDEWRLFELLDGIRNVSEVVRDSGKKRLDVTRSLKKMLDAGAIRLADTKDLLSKGSLLVTTQDYELAAKVYKRLVEVEKAVPAHRELLFETFIKLGQTENALMQLEIMANEYSHRKDHKKAIDALTKILEVDGSRHVIREQIAKQYLDLNKKKDAVAELKHVLQIYVDSGVFEKAKDICQQLLSIDSQDLKVMELFAKTCVNRGDRQEAVEMWSKMGAIHVSLEQYEDAVEVFRKILKIEPTHTHAKDMINELMIRMGKARKRQRFVVVFGGILIVVLVLFGGVFYFDQSIQREFAELKGKNDQIKEDVDRSLSKSEVLEKTKSLIASYESFKKEHYLSFTLFDAQNEIDQLERLKNSKIENFKEEAEKRDKKLAEEFSSLMENTNFKKVKEILNDLQVFKSKIVGEENFEEKLKFLEKRIEYYTKLETESFGLFEASQKFFNAKDVKSANEVSRKILTEYGQTSSAEKVQYYVDISCEQLDCELFINNEKLAMNLPVIHHYKHGDKLTVVIKKEGYHDFEESVELGKKNNIHAKLKRKVLWTYNIGEPVTSDLVFKDGYLFIAARNGKLINLAIEFNNDTFKENWVFMMKRPGRDLFAEGCLDAGRLFIGSAESYLYSINASAGKEYWAKKMSGPLKSNVSVSKISLKQEQKMLFVAVSGQGDQGSILGLDAEKGDIEWEKKVAGSEFSDVISNSAKVYVGTSQNKIIVLKAATGMDIMIEGAENKPVPLEYRAFGPFKGDFALVANEEKEYLLAGCLDQNIYCFEEETGKILWNLHTGSPNSSGITLDGDMVFSASDEGLLSAIDWKASVKSGKVQVSWSIQLENLKDPTQVYATEKIIYLGGATEDKAGKLVAIRKNDGKLLWSLDTSAPINSRPLIIQNRVFVCCDDKKMYVLKELK